VADPDPLAELERQVARGGLFTHTVLSELSGRLEEVEGFLFGLVDLLVKGHLVDGESLVASAARTTATGEDPVPPGPRILMRIDPAEPASVVTVDCAARFPVCRALCCGLAFALSQSEIESATLRWDLGMPYEIRHDEAGQCVHKDASTGRCGVYDGRPAPCRTYSCATDERIWIDFEGMVLNEGWMAEHLGPTRPRLASAAMIPVPTPGGQPDRQPHRRRLAESRTSSD
jgi:Fe-S-cluster containining protein